MLLPVHSRIMILGSEGRPQLQLWAPFLFAFMSLR